MEKLSKQELADIYQRASDASTALDYCNLDNVSPVRRGVATVLSDLALLDESGYDDDAKLDYALARQICQNVIDHFAMLTYKQQLANIPL